MPSTKQNPLNYWCAPNGCTPDYQSQSPENVLGYGLMLSFNLVMSEDTAFVPDLNTAREVQNALLSSVEDIAEWLEIAREEYANDPRGPGYARVFYQETASAAVFLRLLDEDEDEDPKNFVAWRIVFYELDGPDDREIVCIDMSLGEDDDTLWLDVTGLTKEALLTEVEKARTALNEAWATKDEEVTA